MDLHFIGPLCNVFNMVTESYRYWEHTWASTRATQAAYLCISK